MSSAIRLLSAAGLVWFAIYLTHKAQTSADSNAIALFAAVVLVGTIAGSLVVFTLLPKLGEAMGNVVFQPNERIEKNPHAGALAALARGEYEAAVHEYEQVYAGDHEDTHALSEVARIYCEKLHNPDAAAASLEQGLEGELTPEDAAFLSARLADVYWNYRRDIEGARALLLQVTELMPGTRYSANAAHRLQEIERDAGHLS